jgi:ElaB/YqjD/DUF883 family membrane-anchored ribosome-binding protein
MTQAPITSDFGNSTSTSDRLASMAHETIDRVTPKVNRVELEVRGAAARAGDGAKLLQERAVEAAEENLRSMRSYIETNPLTTAGIAFAAGILLMSLIRR